MLYFLYEIFGINIFQYITVRAGVSFFMAFVLTLYLMPKFITWAKAKKANQPIYDLAPQNHQTKRNIPTMGGMVFIFSAVMASFFSSNLNNMFVLAGLLLLISFALIGLKDDLSKIVGKKNEAGLKPKEKLYYQFGSAFVIATILYLFSELDSNFYIPFYKYPLLDIKIIAIVFWALVIVASSNAVNITDGLDGLATFPSIVAIFSLLILTYIAGNAISSAYLLLPKVNGVGEVAIIASALIGSLFGFLWYNCHPAEVFMGDSGSLSIGAFIGYMAIISKNEILLILIGFVFVFETVSVILQVWSFKTRGKRIFLMAPVHHHFEVKGWAESKIIVRFWIMALLSNIIALISIKLR